MIVIVEVTFHFLMFNVIYIITVKLKCNLKTIVIDSVIIKYLNEYNT